MIFILLLIILLILGILLLQSHEVGLEEIVFPPHMFDIFKVALKLLR